MSRTGLLLVGHGTRNAAGIACVEALRNLVAERLAEVVVRHAFLELHEQTVQRGVAELLEEGVASAAAAPLLLFSAGHAKSDIPREIAAAALGRIEFQQADALGCHQALVELSQRRFLETVDGLPPVAASESCLLLVGRGSYDAQATAQMHRFAELRRQQLAGQTVEVAFIAMAQPAVQDTARELASRGFRRIVVQPHLLFPGELLDNLAALVADQQADEAGIDWRMTPPLAADIGQQGPADRLLVDAVIDRAQAALQRLAGV